MKRFLMVWTVALAAVMGVFATPVSEDQARTLANAWVAENGAFASKGTAGAVRAVRDVNAAKTLLWYQVSLSGGGCLMVAPVTEIEPVVAALDSDPGELPAAHPLRGILAGDIRARLKFLGLYPSDEEPTVATRGDSTGGATKQGRPTGTLVRATEQQQVAAEWGRRQSAKWAKFLSPATRAGSAGVNEIPTEINVVDGFEKDGRFTHWNQGNGGGGYCYNYYTPNHAVCGCVATAAAAILQFFGVNRVAPFTNSKCTYNKQAYKATFGEDAKTMQAEGAEDLENLKGYDWSLFEKCETRADYNKLTEEQREVLGRLAFDAGVCFGMGWTDDESGAQTADTAKVLRNYFNCNDDLSDPKFGFADARCVRNPSQDQYAKLIYAQVRAGYPVGMGIDGHAVVAVGHGRDKDGVDRVRVFMGWGGSGDAWYALPNIDTTAVMGGSSYLSTVINSITTMISLDDTATVPVVGQLIPSMSCNMTVGDQLVSSNLGGYFGTRVAAGQTVTIVCQDKSVDVTAKKDVEPTDAGSFTYDGAALCDLIPDESILLLINSESAASMAEAKAKALAAGKPLLFFSGMGGIPASDAVWDVIKQLDDDNVDDFTNQFVVAYFAWDPSFSSPSDGRPSYGVFDPNEFDETEPNHWASFNGRLAWNDFAQCETNIVVGATNYVATAETEEKVLEVIWGGLNAYKARHGGVTLEVVSDPEEVGVEDYVEQAFAPGVEAEYAVPSQITNEVDGVIWQCAGWKVESVAADGTPTDVAAGTDAVAVFTPEADTAYTLTWSWEVAQVRVSCSVMASNGVKYGKVKVADVTDLAVSVWAAPGDKVVFTAIPNTGARMGMWYPDGRAVSVSSADQLTLTVPTDAAAGLESFVQMVKVANCALVVQSSPIALQNALGEQPNPGYTSVDRTKTPWKVNFAGQYHDSGRFQATMTPASVTRDGLVWICAGWNVTSSNPGAAGTAGGSGLSISIASKEPSGTGTTASFVLDQTTMWLTWNWKIDLAATLAAKGWTGGQPLPSTLTLGTLPGGLKLADVEFANTPAGWNADVTETAGGVLVAGMSPTSDWAAENLGVTLTFATDPELGLAQEAFVVSTPAAGQVAVTAPAAVTNFEEGVVYAPASWQVTGDVGASGTGATATFAATSGNDVTVTWSYAQVLVRVAAQFDYRREPGAPAFHEKSTLDKTEVWCAPGETATFRVTIGDVNNIPEGLQRWEVEGADVWSPDGLSVSVTAGETPVQVTAVMGAGAYQKSGALTIAADAEAVAHGAVSDPAFGSTLPAETVDGWNVPVAITLVNAPVYEATVTTNEEKTIEYTNIVTCACAGWELHRGDASGEIVQAGKDAKTAQVLRSTENATFVWLWKISTNTVEVALQEKPRDPAVPPLGPEGSSPLVTDNGVTQVTIANAVSGWWYGVYTTTSLEAPVTWTYLRGAEPGDPATNLNFTVEWDDVPQRFFKVIVTDGEPTAK